jgi:hypothetical protein
MIADSTLRTSLYDAETEIHTAAMYIELCPKYFVAMAEHSICQPGKPTPGLASA